MTHDPATAPRPKMPAGIWALGFVSLLMDVSSEIIHALLPVYLVAVLGVGMGTIGWIEGLAESTASITKVFSGVLSDRLGRRKALALVGYGLAAITKPVFPLAGSVTAIVAARFVDRVGKGIRGAPRDALVAEIAPPEIRGAAFGLRQTLDTIGAVIGPLAAMGLMLASNDDYALVFWVAVIPAAAAVLLLALAVREPGPIRPNPDARLPIRRADLAALGGAYWVVVAIAVAFSAARIGEAFLILRAIDLGLHVALAPLVLVTMNVVYAAMSYPVGRLSDRIGRNGLLGLGLAVFVATNIVLAMSDGLAATFVGIALWGAHLGLTQGLLSTLVADVAPPSLRGTAFGVFNLALGLALLAGNTLGGLVWAMSGAPATFLVSAGLSAIALAGFAGLTWIKGRPTPAG